jgi:hypothetical protein
VTSEGTPHGRFRRALDRRQPTAALSAAAELPQVSLTDALELLLLLAETDRPRFERAALRWHARYCREVTLRRQPCWRCSPVSRGGLPLSLLALLAELLYGRNLEQAARILIRILIRWGDA